ncbi:interferon-induced protein 44-like [Mustelus asterias]
MSKVTSQLTAEDQKQLFQFFGKINLHLLYKASVHGFSANAFHAKCDGQGPTLTVGYNNGYTFGGYTSEDFVTNGNKYDNDAFLFRLTSSELGERPLKFAVKAGTLAICNSLEHGPNFGNSLVFLAGGKTIKCKSSPSYSFNKNDLFGDDVDLLECEVYRVEVLNTPWRDINHRSRNKRSVESYKPYISSVPKARILLIGPIGGGKSSFINSVNSIFRSHATNRVLAGAMNNTKTYSTFSFRGDKDDTSMPLILSDTMGLAEGTESGIHTDDIINIIKGHVPKKYQFNAASPIQADTKGYIKSPAIAERIHCVVYVIDANKPTILSPAMEKKMCAIRSQINKLEIPQMVLLTKVDEVCPLLVKDVTNVYQSKLIEKKVLEVGKQLNIPALCILPVKNYCTEFELDDKTSALLLSAVVQMLHYADDYFENLGEDLPVV